MKYENFVVAYLRENLVMNFKKTATHGSSPARLQKVRRWDHYEFASVETEGPEQKCPFPVIGTSIDLSAAAYE